MSEAGTLWNPDLRSLSEDEKAFLGAIKEHPKTTHELAGLPVEPRKVCERLGLATYEPLKVDDKERPVRHRWAITTKGRVAEFFGYIKPLSAKRVKRAAPGTKAAKKRAAAKRKGGSR